MNRRCRTARSSTDTAPTPNNDGQTEPIPGSQTGSAEQAGSHPHDASCPDADATTHDLTGTDLTHNDADHHPKYYVVRWIKRVC